MTKKRADYELFKSIVDLMCNKEHLSPDGLQKIVNLRASMNNGLSDMLKAAFPETKPVPRLDIEFQGIPNPNWVSGFVEGEGCFLIRAASLKNINNFCFATDGYGFRKKSHHIGFFNNSAFSRL